MKFDKKEFSEIVSYMDLAEYNHEINRCTGLITSLGEDPSEARELAAAALELADPRLNHAKFSLQFLHSPREIFSYANGNVSGMVLEENSLDREGEEIRSRGIGIKHQIRVDTVIFAIGDRVDEDLGLSIEGIEYLKNPNLLYPVDGPSFEILDQEMGISQEGIFLAGWSRGVSKAEMGVAHKDGVNAALSVLQFLDSGKSWPQWSYTGLNARLVELGKFAVRTCDLMKLERAENMEAEPRGLPVFKFQTNEEMLQVIGYAF